MKLWEKDTTLDKDVENYTVSDDNINDLHFVEYDCLASIAHCKMLQKIKILTPHETQILIKELKYLIKIIKQKKFIILKEEEDCHTAIENHLVRRLGKVGKKIHIYRSRNDQILTALRLYYRENLKQIQNLLKIFIETLKIQSEKYRSIPLPGFTHTRKAMPSSINLYFQGFIDSAVDNLTQLKHLNNLINQSPLGSGAGYGFQNDIKRKFTAKELGFKKIQNPIYCQNSRLKFEALILNFLTIVMFDLNKISSDMIFFTQPELNLFQIPQEFLCGSSIMPHKKNPDVFELIRGNYHKVLSQEFFIKSLMSNLISGYHRDFQLSKEPIVKSFNKTCESLQISIQIFRKIKINKKNCNEAMTSELFSAEKVNEIVLKEKLPFRDAYKKISKEM